MDSELAHLLATGWFSEADLKNARATAREAYAAPGGLRQETGHVILYRKTGQKALRTLVIDGRELAIGLRLHDTLHDRAPYRVYFDDHRLVAIEPAPPSEIPDAVASAARAFGLSRDDPRAATDPRVADRLRTELLAGFQRIAGFSTE